MVCHSVYQAINRLLTETECAKIFLKKGFGLKLLDLQFFSEEIFTDIPRTEHMHIANIPKIPDLLGIGVTELEYSIQFNFAS